MTKFPDGAYNALFNNRDSFLKREAAVVDRLINSRDQFFLDALFRIDGLFREFNPYHPYTKEPIFDEPYSQQWMFFFQHLVFSSQQFCSGRAKEFRTAQADHREKLFEIYKRAKELSELMRAEEIHSEKWGLSHDHDEHPLYLLDSAAENMTTTKNISSHEKRLRVETAYLYKNWVLPNLDTARNFALKYYPTIPEILEEISRQYANIDAVEVLDAMPVPRQISDQNFFLELFFNAIQKSIDGLLLPEKILAKKVITAEDWANIFKVSLDNFKFSQSNIDEYKRKTKT